MSKTNNPFKKGDTVSIQRGEGRLVGEVVKTVKARVHILIDGKVFSEDWHDVRRRNIIPRS